MSSGHSIPNYKKENQDIYCLHYWIFPGLESSKIFHLWVDLQKWKLWSFANTVFTKLFIQKCLCSMGSWNSSVFHTYDHFDCFEHLFGEKGKVFLTTKVNLIAWEVKAVLTWLRNKIMMRGMILLMFHKVLTPYKGLAQNTLF